MSGGPYPADFLRIAADRSRLAVLGALASGGGGRRAADVAAVTGVGEREVRRILGRLVAAGLANEDGGLFRLDDAALRRYLVEAGMLLRQNRTRTYWRGGGPPPGGGAPDPPLESP